MVNVLNENYREYLLEVVQPDSAGWQISVYASRPRLPTPPPSDRKRYGEAEEAFAAGRQIVDRLLSDEGSRT
jgi:hypothetical protein